MKLNRNLAVISIWVVVILAMIPAGISYTHYLSYSSGNSAPSGSESAVASSLLNGTSLNNDSLILVVREDPFSPWVANQTLNFQGNGLQSTPFLSGSQSPFSEYVSFLTKVFSRGDNVTLAHQEALKYVEEKGLSGAPQFIVSRYVSHDNSTFLVFITFNESSGYVLPDGQTPSQQAYPKVEGAVNRDFGGNASITGAGAIAYETQQVTSKSAFAFGLIFLVLAVTVGVTLRSVKGSLLSLVFISITTLVGYFAVFLVGDLVTKVDYVVNYTLTAVLIGITTDYVVFLLSRLRQEVREGTDPRRAVGVASRRAGRAVLVSGLTVGVSLLSFSLVPTFLSWGLVLFVAVVMTTVLILTLLPSLLSLGGGRFFGKVKAVTEADLRKSIFYRVSDFSVRRKWLVIPIIFALALPSFLFFLTVPTTYNFNAGLPGNLPSVRALNLVEEKFGSNELYPIIVLAKVNTTVLDNSTLLREFSTSTAERVLSTPGVSDVYGPYVDGKEVTNQSNVSSFLVRGEYLIFTAYSSSGPFSPQAEHTVKELRSYPDLVVGGVTSSVIDEEAESVREFSLLEVLITLFVAVILGVSFKSWRFPLISITGVITSISWATVILYLLSTYVLHQPLIYLIPVILFVILMSLGNDYTVFIISRVKEDVEEHGEEGIQMALSRTGVVVTSLGIILAASLGVLALIPVGFLEQLGIAFILSLLIDTFVIRTVYFPAMLSLLGVKGGK